MSLFQISILSAAEIVGDFGFKEFANKGGIKNFCVGVIGYLTVIPILIVALQNSSVLMVNGAWDGISALLESLAAYIFLGERFESFTQYLGLGLIIIGLALMKVPLQSTKEFVMPKFFPK
jgi:multidrug transporter EmrE-like cation transporter